MNDFCKNHAFTLGANYWASKNATRMWEDWDPAGVDDDFRRLKEQGITVLRCFLNWAYFQPLKAMYANMRLYEYRMMPGEQPLPDTPAGRAGVSEEACRRFDEFCGLAEKHGLKLIVGLLTGDMSFRTFMPEAFEGTDFLTDPRVIEWEIRFVRYFTARFADKKAILAWNLGNECNGHAPTNHAQAYLWAHAITAAIRQGDPDRPIVSGYGNWQPTDENSFDLRSQGELLDVMTTHPYYIFTTGVRQDPIRSLRAGVDATVSNRVYGDVSGKPSLIEEIGSIGYMACSEKSEADFARMGLWTAYAHGDHGYFWWCAFDQGHLDHAPYDWNNLGSDYGLFRRDGSAKPVAEEFRRFAKVLETVGELPDNTREAVCVIPREQSEVLLCANSVFVLAHQANMDVRFAYADSPLPDAKLYLLPSPVSTKPIFLHRLEALLEKVRNGATLYFSTDQLFRRMPELTGLTFTEREWTDRMTVTMDGQAFTVRSLFRYKIEAVAPSCEVLARTDDGQPFFVCNRYGKGRIFFMPYTLELSQGRGVRPFDEGREPWARFYEKFAQGDRAARSSLPSLLLTEHPLSETKRLVTAVNYASDEAVDAISLAPGWHKTRTLWGQDNRVPAFDGCVWEIGKDV